MDKTDTKPKRRRRRLWAAWILLAAAGVCGVLYSYHRWVLHNFGEVVPAQVYRSAQVDADVLEKWAGQYHLRTVVNLTGDSDNADVAREARALAPLGVQSAALHLHADALPTPDQLQQLIRIVETAERPYLLHCKAGADRTGLASVLAAMAIGGKDYAAARSQCSWRYLHVDPVSDHVAGVLTQYETCCRQKGIGTGGWNQFKEWASNAYGRQPTSPG